jgi:hypothetical protein
VVDDEVLISVSNDFAKQARLGFTVEMCQELIRLAFLNWRGAFVLRFKNAALPSLRGFGATHFQNVHL